MPVDPRKCAVCQEIFVPHTAKQRHCSRRCGTAHRNRRRGPRPSARKVGRPPYEQLLAETEALGFLAVGRKYGVSDNAVRKWIRAYEAERESRNEREERG